MTQISIITLTCLSFALGFSNKNLFAQEKRWMRPYLGKEQVDSGLSGIHGGFAFGERFGKKGFGIYLDYSLMGDAFPAEDRLYDFHPSAFGDPILDHSVENLSKWSMGFIIQYGALFGMIGGGPRTRETYTKLRDPMEILSPNGVYFVKNDDKIKQASFDVGGGITIMDRVLIQGRYSRFKAGTSFAIALGFQMDLSD